ncbi:MAG: NrfD/PsrC family molybdoenzyme membrane anchor subunit [Pseudomonadota bacterium]|nr:NrfD/PsrC family molybdoenzyme membrane anchor subunit [Pseudomonadota bacterium]
MTDSNNKPGLWSFIRDGIREVLHGGRCYWMWVGFLSIFVIIGVLLYVYQIRNGLVVTNMSNQVSWGFYISNFTFLVGVAAAAIMLAIPAYIFDRKDIGDVVLMGDTMAVAAVTMAVLFVVVDLGRPDRFWHLLPGIGKFHFPESLLAWDVIVLNGYILLNLAISFYILYSHYRGKEPKKSLYFPLVLIAIFWAISIHTVTAFLYSSNSGRLIWSNALLAPRFIASAFASGPAIMAIGLQIIRSMGNYPVSQSVINHLAIVTSIALQVTLFFIGAEIFTDFYNEGEHAASARYLFFGLHGHAALTPWIWTAITFLLIAVSILMIHRTRKNPFTMNIAFGLTIIGIWIEKGMGLVIPGFVPTPIGEIYEYTPNFLEIMISVGIWAFGLLFFTIMAKAALPIQCRYIMKNSKSTDPTYCEPYDK